MIPYEYQLIIYLGKYIGEVIGLTEQPNHRDATLINISVELGK